MAELTIPILLAVIGLIIGLIAYRTIQRGNARFYALERESILRRASFTLLASLILFVGSVAMMVNTERLQIADADNATATAEAIIASGSTLGTNPTANTGVVVTQQQTPNDSLEPIISSAPPTIEPTATIDPNIPTATPKPIPKFAEITNTGESGVYIREIPGTEADPIDRLYDGQMVTLKEDEGNVEANGYVWVKVQTGTGDVGWIADLFIESSN